MIWCATLAAISFIAGVLLGVYLALRHEAQREAARKTGYLDV